MYIYKIEYKADMLDNGKYCDQWLSSVVVSAKSYDLAIKKVITRELKSTSYIDDEDETKHITSLRNFEIIKLERIQIIDY